MILRILLVSSVGSVLRSLDSTCTCSGHSNSDRKRHNTFLILTLSLSTLCTILWCSFLCFQRQQQYRSPLHILSKEADVLKGRRWTPPLSPSVVRLKLDGEENLPTAAEFLSMLRRPGVPPLRSVVELKKLVGAASRAWVRDFRIRGGR